nr:uncharacterized protein LOC129280875 [Lytechinus pictus]
MVRLRRFVGVLTIFLQAWFVLVMLVRAVEGRGSGYIGCYPVGYHVQSVFNHQPYNTTTVDECLLFCRDDFEKHASILGNSCFCSNSIPDDSGTIEKAENDWCDKNCSGNSGQKCGGRAHYSVFNTTVGICPPLMPPSNGGVSRILFREGERVNFSCRPGYSLIGNDTIECLSSQWETGKPIWSGDAPKCGASGAWSLGWVRLLIVVAVLIAGTFLIILIFL